ncbi:MAG: hypothetical protein CLLPBCKN_000394 [Chroococcidiopsis cubana SAG 39.79]|uniref:Uncharacterized protein n=1 Tax=Chroococcidiopsis cubana SAG 39.79 TaxID=388085 RepID=A0AB37UD05_9CYAN|nr:hypothetical protein [Chroococcidiopsis cubana]MDZ4871006.1 hypothetical protein [Chroococcidiopsis cubana SAG 39.79]RUT05436.1 hypothetical protein DSM107010_55140 [Chroococcidiopsis cubana SAG 39.79]
MYGILEPPTIATSELHSHLEQQAQSVAPQIELVAATISVERLGLTRNASSTPYIVYRVKERRCCTFFKRKLLWQLMQAMLRAEYRIEDKIRSIISTPDFSLSFFIGSSWRHVLNHQICRFVERANNLRRLESIASTPLSAVSPPEETISDPVEILVAAMKLAIAKSNWNLVKGEIAAYPEYKTIAWAQLTRDEKQQLCALVPEAVKLLVEAKRNGAIAQYCEASEDGLYWVQVTLDSPPSLVTSCGVGNFIKEAVARMVKRTEHPPATSSISEGKVA